MLKPAMPPLVLLDSNILQVRSHGAGSWPIGDFEDVTGNLRQRSSEAPSGVSMAQLPLSQQSLNMAFHVLDKDRDGLISAAEAYKMVAFYLVRLQHLQHPHTVLDAGIVARCAA